MALLHSLLMNVGLKEKKGKLVSDSHWAFVLVDNTTTALRSEALLSFQFQVPFRS